MKKFFIVSLAVLALASCEKRADYVILSGKIVNSHQGSVRIAGGELDQSLTLKEDGSFLDTLNLKQNYYTLYDPIGQIYVPLFLSKGDEVNIEIDASNPVESLKISGKDSVASVYLQQKMKLTQELQQEFGQAFTQGVDGFRKSLEQIEQKFNGLISSSKKLPKEFVKLEKKSNKFTDLQLKTLFPRMYERINNEKIEMPKDFADELAKIDYDNATDFETFTQYRELVTENFFSKIDNENPDWSAQIQRIRELKSDNIKAHLTGFLPKALSVNNSFEVNAAILETIKEFIKDEQLVKRAETIFAELENFKMGKPSPAFNYENFKGGKTSSESLKGKLIYVDVWATWCKPCVEELPALAALEKEFKDKGVAFVSISIDHDKQKWTEFLTENKLTGIQLHTNSMDTENDFIRFYQINTIPRFILIDKNGNIINANAPRPSSDNIKELLNKHL